MKEEPFEEPLSGKPRGGRGSRKAGVPRSTRLTLASPEIRDHGWTKLLRGTSPSYQAR